MIKNMKEQKGFTLIELMVVVAIIGIILAIAIPNFVAYRKSANDQAAEADIRSIGAAMEKLTTDEGKKQEGGVPCSTVVDEAKITPEFLAGTLARAYYGWSGTTVKSGVQIKKDKCVAPLDTASDCFRAMALAGSSPNGATSRFVYQVPITGGASSPPTVEDVTATWGSSYAPAATDSDKMVTTCIWGKLY